MNIRLLAAEDADAYRRIRLQALSEHPEAFSSSFEEESKYTAVVYRERFQSPDSFTFGAFEQENLIGTVTLLKETKLKLKHRSHIVGMYVSSSMRKQGRWECITIYSNKAGKRAK
ncbi:GNAT family N-acetyltransferase [Bacillus sp. Bva_UNVM-123]|uniref:GNAT family N-acetyltransferase n=1 Tax=Bacillus sp. Bva_UNVM-123 TaxID=2829798 RepID=UPI00391F542B